MKKRIFSSMLLLTILSLIVASIALSAVFYMKLSSSVQKSVKDQASILKEDIFSLGYESLHVFDMRLTIISPEGVVLYDDDQDASTLSNHADREEFREAIAYGSGESLRFSDTLGQETYYYAIKLDNGLILRLARTTSSIWGMIGGAIPIVLIIVAFMLAIGYFLAGSLTKQIIDPINMVNINESLYAPYDELTPFVRTIAEQRERIEEQMADLQSRTHTIEAIMDSMSEGILIVDKKGFLLSVNKSAQGIFSLTSSFEGRSVLEILRDIELTRHMHLALSGVRGEMNFSHNNMIYRVYFSPVTDRGALILFLDITEISMSEKLRREFSANVSHELKTPLTTIYGNAEMLEGGMVKDADKAVFYGKIKDEASRLISLIEDIIMLSQLDEENGNISIGKVNLLEVATEAVKSLESRAKEQQISINITGSSTIQANRSQMSELFYNLIENAVKYNKIGGTVCIEIETIDDQAKIKISDTGIGIPKHAQRRVFERFYRVDKSRSRTTGGTGLGLSIVKHIVLAYNGSLELQSTLDEGTTITIFLKSMK